MVYRKSWIINIFQCYKLIDFQFAVTLYTVYLKYIRISLVNQNSSNGRTNNITFIAFV